MKREPGRPKGANLFPVGALSLVKNVAVLRFFCAVSGWKNQVPTFFKARQEKGSLSPACEWFPQTKALVRSNEDGKAQKVRIYAAYRVSQLSNKNKERKVNEMTEEVLRVEHLNKFYGKHQTLVDVNFSLNKGVVLSLLGPSG